MELDEFDSLKREAAKLDHNDSKSLKTFYVRMVSSFKEFAGIADNILGITIIIYKIGNVESLNKSIKELAELLPSHVSLILTDYNSREVYEPLLDNLKEKACRIKIPNQNTAGATKKLPHKETRTIRK